MTSSASAEDFGLWVKILRSRVKTDPRRYTFTLLMEIKQAKAPENVDEVLQKQQLIRTRRVLFLLGLLLKTLSKVSDTTHKKVKQFPQTR